ncbi:MAG: hypothetical protein N4A47_02110 [Clostridia bacterium]|jgi:hypothetical protein|nr:hypothetical protein [Clostridia bacterium]
MEKKLKEKVYYSLEFIMSIIDVLILVKMWEFYLRISAHINNDVFGRNYELLISLSVFAVFYMLPIWYLYKYLYRARLNFKMTERIKGYEENKFIFMIPTFFSMFVFFVMSFVWCLKNSEPRPEGLFWILLIITYINKMILSSIVLENKKKNLKSQGIIPACLIGMIIGILLTILMAPFTRVGERHQDFSVISEINIASEKVL